MHTLTATVRSVFTAFASITNKLTARRNLKKYVHSSKKIPWIDNGYYYSGKDKPAKDPYYYAGLYYLQEPSAMTPAHVTSY